MLRVVLQLLHEPKLIFASVCASFTTQIWPITPPRCRGQIMEDCVALGRLAAEQLENKTRIARAGGIEAVVKAIQTHAQSAYVQMHGCVALSVLAGVLVKAVVKAMHGCRALAMCTECSR